MTAKFIVLAGDTYYPSRWDDFVGAAIDLDAAKRLVADLDSGPDWVQIVSTDSWTVVAEGERGWIPGSTALDTGGLAKTAWEWEHQ